MAIENQSENMSISVSAGSVVKIIVDDEEQANVTVPENWRYNVGMNGNLIQTN